ncbi:MAG: DUF1501 domain-containing protein [Saprospiraceae bacterium]|nr:DUF1501 domain-containing protein [Saprospiraceae bacterium]
MDRRDFIKLGAPMGAVPFLFNGMLVKAFNSTSWLPPEICEEVLSRIVVLIQMRGGNDGANTIIPISQYDLYANLRPDIRIRQNDFIPLDNTLASEDQIGLHPAMTGFKELYDRGDLNVIQSVAYTQPNLSHFKSTDLWLTGGDGTSPNYNLPSGWMARYLNYAYPDLAGNPSTAMPDPLGIQIGQRKPSLGFHSEEEHGTAINLAGQDPNGFFTLLNELGGIPPENIPSTEYGDQVQYVVDVIENANVYAERLADVFNAGNNSVTYPGTYLGNQLKTVAKLIDGGCKSKVYLVDISGFDTHVNQTEVGDSTIGEHANLLAQLSDAVLAFQDDLTALGYQDKVLTVTFSEFGRKAIQNDNNGTDHGNLAPMFVIGTSAKAGVTGTNIDFSTIDGQGRFLDPMQHDYRQVFTTVIQDWLGVDDDGIAVTRFQEYADQKLPIIDDASVVPEECYFSSVLPVELVFFRAEPENNERVSLTWRTSSETDSDYFEVLRSIDGINFEVLERQPAAGNSTSIINYYGMDYDPFPGTSFYQLKQVDLDGTEHFFNIERVDLFEEAKLKVYPNPVVYKVFFAVSSPEDGEATIQVYSIGGRLIAQQQQAVVAGFNKLEMVVSSFPAGNYIVQLELRSSLGKVTRLEEKLVKT